MPVRPIIEVRSCRFRYEDASDDTVHIDDLALQPSQHLFIKGRSGSGKSTFLNLLCGVLTPEEGIINVLNAPFSSRSNAEKDRIRADHYGIIFQQFNLLAHLSVKENIALGCSFSERKKARVSDMDAAVKALLEKLDLPLSLLSKPAMSLSVGQQQRVAVARALIGKPEIIIADEPTSALDPETREDFMRLLFEQVDAQQSTLIFVSHDASLAARFPQVVSFEKLNQAKR